MPQNFFITGMPKAGKTTLLIRLIKELEGKGLRVGGFVSPEEKHHGTRTAFYVENIRSGKRAVLASVDGSGPKVSKYHVNIKSFESIALPVMKNIGNYDVLIIDEIGRMEMKSLKFSDMLDKAFEHRTPVIATLHNDYVNRYSVEGEVHMLTNISREAVHLTLLKKVTGAYLDKPKKAKPEKRRAKKTAKKSRPKKKASKKTSGKKKTAKKKTAKKKSKRAARKPKKKVRKTKKVSKKTKRKSAGKPKASKKKSRKVFRKKPSKPKKPEKVEKPAPKKRKSIRNHVRDFLGF